MFTELFFESVALIAAAVFITSLGIYLCTLLFKHEGKGFIIPVITGMVILLALIGHVWINRTALKPSVYWVCDDNEAMTGCSKMISG